MKLPKELRIIGIEEMKKQIYNTFKNIFNKLNNLYDPHYSVKYLKMGQSGKYSDMVYQNLGGYNRLDTKHFLLMVKAVSYTHLTLPTILLV